MSDGCRIGKVTRKIEIVSRRLTEPEESLKADYNYLMECDIEAYGLVAMADSDMSISYYFDGMTGDEFYMLFCEMLREQLLEDGLIETI